MPSKSKNNSASKTNNTFAPTAMMNWRVVPFALGCLAAGLFYCSFNVYKVQFVTDPFPS